MKEQLITLETAKLAKEKGFDWQCLAYYRDEILYDCRLKQIENSSNLNNCCNKNNVGYTQVACPTQSLLQKWLRENHEIEVVVKSWKEFNKIVYMYSVNTVGDPSTYLNKLAKETYEQAFEAGLKEGLEILQIK